MLQQQFRVNFTLVLSGLLCGYAQAGIYSRTRVMIFVLPKAEVRFWGFVLSFLTFFVVKILVTNNKMEISNN